MNIKLTGLGGNSSALGAKISIFSEDDIQILEQNPYRGYQSSVSTTLHFGLGDISTVDSLLVVWPGGKITKEFDIPTNQILELAQAEASGISYSKAEETSVFLAEKLN